MRAAALISLAAPIVVACGGAPPARVVPARAAIVLGHADARVGTYVSKPHGFDTSSYWIEGPAGLVMIDTQFLPSAAEESVRWAEEATAKKVVAAVVLHANPDKFNGTQTLQKRGISVLTSDPVAALIPEVHAKRTRAFFDRYKPDYPGDVPRPETFGASTHELTIAGVHMTVHVLGAGCSEAHVVVEWQRHVFVGDLVANGTHAWMEIGKTDAWLKRLDEIENMKPEWVHPGRGPSGGVELLARQRAYLKAVQEIVAAEKPQRKDDAEGIQRAKAKVKERFPGLDYEVFLDIGLPAEWNRQVR
jgi:glyoxylase-like metal-dependent hydrolase (beta-lactamase superfamily II)